MITVEVVANAPVSSDTVAPQNGDVIHTMLTAGVATKDAGGDYRMNSPILTGALCYLHIENVPDVAVDNREILEDAYPDKDSEPTRFRKWRVSYTLASPEDVAQLIEEREVTRDWAMLAPLLVRKVVTTADPADDADGVPISVDDLNG